MYQISLVHVLSIVDDRFALIPLQSYKRFGPLRAHFSLLGYKNGRVLGSICSRLPKLFISNLPRLFCSRSILGFPSFSWYYGLFQAHNYSSWKKSLLEVSFQYTILSIFNPYFTFLFFLFFFTYFLCQSFCIFF